MSSDAETSNITTTSPSDEVRYRTEEIKQSLLVWRNILLRLNNLLEWEHKYDPLIIFGILTFIFIFIHQVNSSILTLVSSVVLIFILIDLFAPVDIGMVYKNENWTSIDDGKYSIICERIAYIEQYIKHKYKSALKMRQERPIMYLMIGIILLSFIAYCGQRIDNPLLSYLTILIVCLIPGIRNRELIQYIRDFWNKNKTSVSSYKTKMQ